MVEVRREKRKMSLRAAVSTLKEKPVMLNLFQHLSFSLGRRTYSLPSMSVVHRPFLAFCLLSFLLCAPVPAQTVSFRDPIHLPTGNHPGHITAADINHDGYPDLLIANADGASITVYLGDGKGGFTQAKGSPVTGVEHPCDIAVGDFNSNGNPDLAVPSHGLKLVSILLGDGKGGFTLAPGSPMAVESNPHPHGIAVADFNGDKKLDIVIDSWAENKLLVLYGNGDGTFAPKGVKFDVGKWPYQRVRSADMNGDGIPDIITSNITSSSVTVLLGNGKGGFDRKDTPVPDAPFGIAIGDFNGDHHPDVAVCHYSGQGFDASKDGLSVLWGNGKGNFTLEKGSPFHVGHYPSMVAAGDINGDGIADIAVPNNMDNTISVFLGGKNGIKEAKGSPFHVGRGPESIALADFNRDGKADLAVTDLDDNEVLVFITK